MHDRAARRRAGREAAPRSHRRNIHQRLVEALGDDDPEIIGALELAYSGAMLQTGTGHLSYDDLGDRLAGAANLILGGRR